MRKLVPFMMFLVILMSGCTNHAVKKALKESVDENSTIFGSKLDLQYKFISYKFIDTIMVGDEVSQYVVEHKYSIFNPFIQTREEITDKVNLDPDLKYIKDDYGIDDVLDDIINLFNGDD